LPKVLIIGATGFIGNKLAHALASGPFELVISVRDSSNLSKIEHLNFKKIKLDFLDIASMAKIFNEIKPDYIINNAGVTKAKTQKEYDLVNVDFAINVAKAAMIGCPDLKKYVYISSLAAHGPADFQKEDKLYTHQSPNPVTKYGVSKLKAENELKKIQGLKYLFLRPTAVYGPEEKDLYTVFKMVNMGLGLHSGHGDQKLSFIFIEDLIKIILGTLTENNVNKTYFVTDGNFYTPKKLNVLISTALHKKIVQFGLPLAFLKVIASVSEFFGRFSREIPPLNLDKINEIKANNWDCDIEPLVKDLGHQPKILLEEGVNKTVRWYKENKWI
jgi:UDP-glucose 4-epimerase